MVDDVNDAAPDPVAPTPSTEQRLTALEGKVETVAAQSAQVNAIRQDIALVQNAIADLTSRMRACEKTDTDMLEGVKNSFALIQDRIDLIVSKIGPNL